MDLENNIRSGDIYDKKTIKICISLVAFSWLAKKLSLHHSNNGKQVEPLTTRLRRRMEYRK